MAAVYGPPVHDVLCQRDIFVNVNDRLFKLHTPNLIEGSIVFKNFLASTSLGKTIDDPIPLHGPTQDQFASFLWGVYVRPLPKPLDLKLDQLFAIAELAHIYAFSRLKTWALGGIRSLATCHDTLLRTATSDTFARVLRLALIYGQPQLAVSIQTKWISRIHWKSLPPSHAVNTGFAFDLPYLTSHALYAHMVNLEPYLSGSRRVNTEVFDVLSSKQNLHLYCGYYSLVAYWSYLRKNPTCFEKYTTCRCHHQCLHTWSKRWVAILDKKWPDPKVDVLRRLQSVGAALDADRVVQICMTPECRKSALASVGKKRDQISFNLYHHFDL